MPFVRVAAVAEVSPGVGKLVEAGGRKIALFFVDGVYFALDEVCPHRGAPMHEGICYGAEVECPWHAARFDLATGKNLNPPAKSPLRSYAVRVLGDAVEVEV